MGRAKLFLICLLCAITAPVLLIAMACQAAFGSTDRALSMAIAYDVCGNVPCLAAAKAKRSPPAQVTV